MILPRTNNKILLGFVALIPMLLAVFLFASPHVYARTDARGYFTGVNLNGPAYCANCNTGLDAVAPQPPPQPHGPNVPDGFNNTMGKAQFIAKVHEFNDSGVSQYQTAAALYVSLINGYKTSRPPNAGDFAEFEARVNNPTISIRYDYRSDRENSAYYAAGNDEVFFTESVPVDRYSMIFYDSTRDYTVIKLDCGNPLGQLALPPPNRLPIVILDYVNCTTDLTGWARDPDTDTRLNFQTIDNGVLSGLHVANHARTEGGSADGFGYIISKTDIPGYNPRAVNNVTVRAYDANTGEAVDSRTVSFGPCISVACTSSNFPSNMGVGQQQSFHVISTLSTDWGPPYNTGPGGNNPDPRTWTPAMYVTVFDPSGTPVYQQATKYSAGAYVAGPVLTSYDITFTPMTPGEYKMQWAVSGGGVPYVTCGYGAEAGGGNTSNSDGHAGYQPFFRIEDGDAAAGPGFGNGSACVPDSSATFKSFNQSGPSYFGSGTNLGTVTSGILQSFATGTNNDSRGSSSSNGRGQPSGLAFANTGGGGDGAFDKASWCSPDYYGDAGTGSGLPPGGILSGKHVYNVPNGYVLYGTRLAAGADVTIKVNGDIKISGDVLYSYASLDMIPRFKLLVTGNIYIQNTVHELHGFYVAQPGASGTGELYTCANGATAAHDFNFCNSSLKIYGSVSARKIVLGRTSGNFNNNSTLPSETFQNSPELWIFPTTITGSTSAISSYDSITNLPPVL